MNAPDDCPTLEDCVVASDGIPGVTQPEDARAALAAELAELRRKAAAWDQHIGEAALDPATPIEMIDTELRAMGVDPVALAARGVEFVAQVKADLKAQWSITQPIGYCDGSGYGAGLYGGARLKCPGCRACR